MLIKVFRSVAMHCVLVIVAWHNFWLQMEVRCQYAVSTGSGLFSELQQCRIKLRYQMAVIFS